MLLSKVVRVVTVGLEVQYNGSDWSRVSGCLVGISVISQDGLTELILLKKYLGSKFTLEKVDDRVV